MTADVDTAEAQDEPDAAAAHPGSQGSDAEAHGGDGAEISGPEGDAQAGSGAVPGSGGFRDRDPETEAPRMPSIPETQDGGERDDDV